MMSKHSTPFLGVYYDSEGQPISLATGQVVDGTAMPDMSPFNGNFYDENGEVHNISELSKQGERGDKGDPGPKGDKGDKGDPGELPEIDSELSESSLNPVQNKVITNALKTIDGGTF